MARAVYHLSALKLDTEIYQLDAARTPLEKTKMDAAMGGRDVSAVPVYGAYDPGTKAVNNLRVASNVVSAQKVTIGADVYEIDIVNTDSTDTTAAANSFNNTTSPLVCATFTDSYTHITIGVGGLIRVESEILRCTAASGKSRTFQRGASGTTPAAHADATAIYVSDGIAAGSTVAVGLVTTLTPTAFIPALVADINSQGTELIDAAADTTIGVILTARSVGAVATACSETLTGTNNVFSNTTMVGGSAQTVRKVCRRLRVPTATEVALDHMHFSFDFTPVIVQVFVAPTATPGAWKVWDGAVTISGGLVTVDNSGAVDFAATDNVIVLATN